MATILKRGDLQWQAKIRQKGFPSQTRTFNFMQDAEAWSRQIENGMEPLDVLQSLGCNETQGYYFSPPFSSDEFILWNISIF